MSPEPVLDAAQDAVDVVVVAFELQHHVDDVFQDFRAGDDAVLGDVSDYDDRRPVCLAYFCSKAADSRICDTLPGDESIVSV